MNVTQPPGHFSISEDTAVLDSSAKLRSSGPLSPDDHSGGNARGYADSPGTRYNEAGYFGTLPFSPESDENRIAHDAVVATGSATESSQYRPAVPGVSFPRNTVISGISDFSGATDDSGRNTVMGSDPKAPMLPGKFKSTFDDDTPPNPRRRLILCGIKRSHFFILVVVCLFLVGVGVSVGVGVGLGMSKTGNSSPFSEHAQETPAPTGTT
jgi:hypothetical protein